MKIEVPFASDERPFRDRDGRASRYEPRHLDKFVSDGVVTRERDGRFNPNAVRVAYIRHLRRARRLNPHTENRARYEAAKARELELRDAQKEGFSILTEESLANITGLFLTGLSGLAARCSRDLGIREVIENEIFKLRQAISDTAERKARELEARMQADTKRQAA